MIFSFWLVQLREGSSIEQSNTVRSTGIPLLSSGKFQMSTAKCPQKCFFFNSSISYRASPHLHQLHQQQHHHHHRQSLRAVVNVLLIDQCCPLSPAAAAAEAALSAIGDGISEHWAAVKQKELISISRSPYSNAKIEQGDKHEKAEAKKKKQQ